MRSHTIPYVIPTFVLLCYILYIVPTSTRTSWLTTPYNVLTQCSGIEYFKALLANLLHNNWAHITSNMLLLSLAGTYVERSLGHCKTLILILISMCMSIGAHIYASAYLHPNSLHVHFLGASGVVFGVLSSYSVLVYHETNITYLHPTDASAI